MSVILDPRKWGKPKKGLGWIPNPPDRNDLDIDVLGLSTLDLSDKVSLWKYVVEVLDQGFSNSCVGQAIAHAIMILESRAGLSYDLVSILAIYFNSRRAHGGHKQDAGTYIRVALKMLQKLGVSSAKEWPFTTNKRKINRRPPWNAYMMGHPRKDGLYINIKESGDQRVKALMAALQASFPIVWGTDVPISYLEDEGPVRVHKPFKGEKIAGGHAQVLIGYEIIDGYVWFECLNSWSNRWRLDGRVFVSEEWVKDKSSRDFQIVKGWKRLQQAGKVN